MTTEMSTDQMLVELTITFPKLWKRRLSEFGKAYATTPGIWTGADAHHDMPDGDPIFDLLCPDDDFYDGFVHVGFIAWLDARGWGIERYDGDTFFLLPKSNFDWVKAWPAEHSATVPPSALADSDPCPF